MNRAWAVALCVAVGCCLNGCRTQEALQHRGALPHLRNTWTAPGVLRWAGYAPDNLNPMFGQEQIDGDLAMLWGAHLLIYDDQNRWAPDLATTVPTQANGGVSRDGLTITYHLRRSARWQDGAQFTSSDVAFSWRQIMNPANNVPVRTGYDNILSIATPDPYTVIVHLRTAYAPFVSSFFVGLCVLPEHVLAHETHLERSSFNNRPLGTGPFKVVEYRASSLIRFTPNLFYWRGVPHLKEIDYLIVPDENTLLVMLRAHEIDFWHGAPAPMQPLFAQLSGYRTLMTPYNERHELAFNTSSTILSDVLVRRALASATNVGAIIRDISHNLYVAGDTDQPSFGWAHGSHVTHYPYNPQIAARLLDAAGWRIGPDGLRHRGGRPLDVVIVGSGGIATVLEVEEIVQSQWRNAGIHAVIKNVAPSLLFASFENGGVMARGNYDVGVIGWAQGADPDDSFMIRCSAIPPAGQNYYRFCDADVDRAEKAALTTYDRSARRVAYDRIQRDVSFAEPYLNLWYVRSIDLMNSDFKNFRPTHAQSAAWNAWEWQI